MAKVVIFALIVTVSFQLLAAFSFLQGKNYIAVQCIKIGAFHFDGVVYECSKKEVKK